MSVEAMVVRWVACWAVSLVPLLAVSMVDMWADQAVAATVDLMVALKVVEQVDWMAVE